MLCRIAYLQTNAAGCVSQWLFAPGACTEDGSTMQDNNLFPVPDKPPTGSCLTQSTRTPYLVRRIATQAQAMAAGFFVQYIIMHCRRLVMRCLVHAALACLLTLSAVDCEATTFWKLTVLSQLTGHQGLHHGSSTEVPCLRCPCQCEPGAVPHVLSALTGSQPFPQNLVAPSCYLPGSTVNCPKPAGFRVQTLNPNFHSSVDTFSCSPLEQHTAKQPLACTDSGASMRGAVTVASNDMHTEAHATWVARTLLAATDACMSHWVPVRRHCGASTVNLQSSFKGGGRT